MNILKNMLVGIGTIVLSLTVVLPISEASSAQDNRKSAASAGSLVINWAGVIDNGEGDRWPHGPHGSLHVLVYPPSQTCPGNQRNYPRPLTHVYLSGPSDGEWLDGDARSFNDLEVYLWRHNGLDSVKVFVYESDPGRIGRAHDPLFCRVVPRRRDPGVWRSYHGTNADAVRNVAARRSRWHERWGLPLREGMPAMIVGFETVANPGSYNYR